MIVVIDGGRRVRFPTPLNFRPYIFPVRLDNEVLVVFVTMINGNREFINKSYNHFKNGLCTVQVRAVRELVRFVGVNRFE